jgi:hypothetical protein
MHIVGKSIKKRLSVVHPMLPVLLGLAIVLGLASPASAAVSATPDHTTTFNGSVRAIVYSGTTAFVAGDFTVAYSHGQSKSRNRVAAIDSTSGDLLSQDPGADALVRGLAVSGGTVFAVGDFATFGGLTRHRLAAFDAASGAVLPTFSDTVNNITYAAAVGNGRLYIGGSFTSVAGASRLHAAAFSLGTGDLDPTWRPDADSRVESIAVTSSRVYLGGPFTSINGSSGTAHVAAVDPVSGDTDTTFQSTVGIPVHALALTATALYVAGDGPGGRGVRLSLSGQTLWTVAFDGGVQAVTVADRVYFGGHFDNACPAPRNNYSGCAVGYVSRVKFAATDVNGVLTSWAPMGNGVHGVFVFAVNATGTKVAAGGDFTTVNGVSQRRFAQFSG